MIDWEQVKMRIAGVHEEAEAVAERVTSFLQSGLNSPVQARIGRHRDPSGWVHCVEVPRQRGFEPLAHNGRVFVRRGRSNVQPYPAELQDLYNLFGYIVTEEPAIEAAGVEAIDVQSFQAYLARLGLDVTGDPQPDLEDDMMARGVVSNIGGDLRATLFGALAFGKTPQSYPQTRSFWVECVAYAGTDRAGEVLQVAEGKGRVDLPLVPRAAVREVLVNAVAHRDYAIIGSQTLLEVFSDRLTVTSPGRLPNRIRIESVKRRGRPRSRNRSIASFLLVMQKMEKRGRGWQVMRRAMMEQDGTGSGMEMDEDPVSRFVNVTLRLTPPARNGEHTQGTPP